MIIIEYNIIKLIDAIAYRICDTNGQWLWGNWTNYTECLQILPNVCINYFHKYSKSRIF